MIARILLLIGCVSAITLANECDNNGHLHRTDFWLPDSRNCHSYFHCERLFLQTLNYTRHELSCGQLFWSQKLTTCMLEKPENAKCEISTPSSTCNFVVNPDNNREYKPKDDRNMNYTIYQSCAENSYFDLQICTCLPNSKSSLPLCVKIDQYTYKQIFMHFRFDGDVDDVTCTNAFAVVKRQKTQFVESPQRKAFVLNGNGYIDIPLTRRLFFGNYFQNITIAFFFKTDNINGTEVLVDNGSESKDSTILLEYISEENVLRARVKVSAMVGSTRDEQILDVKLPMDSPVNKWNHVCLVYVRNLVAVVLNGDISYVDKVKPYTKRVYTIDDNDSSLTIGGRGTGNVHYNSMIDEFKVFKAGLSLRLVKRLTIRY